MKFYTFIILLGLFFAGCGDQSTQFTRTSELDDGPFRRDLEARIKNRGGTVSDGDTIVDLIIKAKGSAGSSSSSNGKKCEKCPDKVDIHFYVGFTSFKKPTFWHTVWNTFPSCLNKFAKYTHRKGFLSHLKTLNWQFTYSMFSSGKNQPGYLEFDGRHVPEVHRAFKRKSTHQFILNRSFSYYESIFTYTLTRYNSAGDSFYVNHNCSNPADCTIWYDAPKYDHAINKGGLEDPLAGLDDILTNKYGAIRANSRVEVFVVTDTFPDYTDKEIRSFTKKYKGVRVHLLSSHSQSKFLGSLRDIAQAMGGEVKQLCSHEDIGPELAKIIKRK